MLHQLSSVKYLHQGNKTIAIGDIPLGICVWTIYSNVFCMCVLAFLHYRDTSNYELYINLHCRLMIDIYIILACKSNFTLT